MGPVALSRAREAMNEVWAAAGVARADQRMVDQTSAGQDGRTWALLERLPSGQLRKVGAVTVTWDAADTVVSVVVTTVNKEA